MAGHRAFEVAIDMAQRQRDAARRLLVQQRGQCANAQAHLDQLTGYAQETRQRWGAKEGARLLPEVLRHQLQFLQRLEQTAQMQQTVVQAQQRRVQQAVQQLAAAEARLPVCATCCSSASERRRWRSSGANRRKPTNGPCSAMCVAPAAN